jgi:hypothetical protein
LSRRPLFAAFVLLAFLGLASPAVASAPFASSQEAQSKSATSASIRGNVVTRGEETTYHFEYALASSDFCSTGSGEHSSTPAASAGSVGGTSVYYTLTGLISGAEYCFATLAANPSGPAAGESPRRFVAGAPQLFADEAEPVSSTSHRIRGEVNPAGQATTLHVEYALGASTFCGGESASSPVLSTAPQSLGAADTEFHDVAVTLTGLVNGQRYCADIVATNGSTTERDRVNGLFTAGLPVLSFTDPDALPLGPTSERLRGRVDPAGQASTFSFDYAEEGSEFCDTSGDSGDSLGVTPPQSAGSGPGPIDVEADVTGLVAGTGYCFRLMAANATGDNYASSTRSFTAGLPRVDERGLFDGTPTSVTLRAMVHPGGQSTDASLGVAEFRSEWCNTNGNSGEPLYRGEHNGLTGTEGHAISDGVTGLSPGTNYCFIWVATNASGTATTGGSSFGTSSAGGPTAITDDATNVTGSGATLNAQVNPMGNAGAQYHFEYGLSAATLDQSSPAAAVGPGYDDRFLEGDIESLSSDTDYYYRVVVDHGGTQLRGAVQEFHTRGAGLTPAAPSGLTARADDGPVVLNWDDVAGATGYRVQRRTPPSGFPRLDTPIDASASDFVDSDVTRGTRYCYRVRARNAAGAGPLSPEVCATSGEASPVTAGATGNPPAGGGTANPPGGGGTGGTLKSAGTSSNSGPSTQTASANGLFDSGIAVTCVGPGVCTAYGSAKGTVNLLHAARLKTLVLARGRRVLSPRRRGVVKLRLSPAGRAALRRHKRLTLRVTVVLVGFGRSRVSRTRTIVLKAPRPVPHRR